MGNVPVRPLEHINSNPNQTALKGQVLGILWTETFPVHNILTSQFNKDFKSD